MILILLKLSLTLGLFFGKCHPDDGIDFNLFQQNDYQLQFERVEVARYSKEIFKEFSIVTFKYNRTVTVINVTLTSKVDLHDDIMNTIQGYKFMSNEYRTFPIRFNANSCKAIAQNIAGIMSGLKRCGNFTGCPILKGIRYHVCNWYPDTSKLPPLIPNGQYKFETHDVRFSQEILALNVYLTVFRSIV